MYYDVTVIIHFWSKLVADNRRGGNIHSIFAVCVRASLLECRDVKKL